MLAGSAWPATGAAGGQGGVSGGGGQAAPTKAGPAVPGLEPGNPSVPNGQAPPPGGAPGQTQFSWNSINWERLPGESQQQYRNRIRAQAQQAAGRGGGGAPVINIPNDFRNAVPQGAVDISIAFFVTIAVCIVGLPIARAFARRMNARSAAIESGTGHVAPQIEQLQNSIDAMALELERISESQRFQSKLLAERPESVRADR
jgi:hypothetical protein